MELPPDFPGVGFRVGTFRRCNTTTPCRSPSPRSVQPVRDSIDRTIRTPTCGLPVSTAAPCRHPVDALHRRCPSTRAAPRQARPRAPAVPVARPRGRAPGGVARRARGAQPRPRSEHVRPARAAAPKARGGGVGGEPVGVRPVLAVGVGRLRGVVAGADRNRTRRGGSLAAEDGVEPAHQAVPPVPGGTMREIRRPRLRRDIACFEAR